VKLVVLNETGTVPFQFLTFTLTNVLVASVALNGNGTTSAQNEALMLLPEIFEVTYTPQLSNGAAGGSVSTTYNCLTGVVN
jgi:type VI protein secretion system component Hcp